MSDKRGLHYSWIVCFGCAILIFCTSGLAVNAFTVYQPYIISENGFTNTMSSLIIMIRNLFSLFSMLCVGLYYKRLSLRFGMYIAGLMITISFLLFGLSGSFIMYLISSAVMGTGYGLGTMIPIAVILGNWFSEKRSTAIGICSAVTGLSTIGFPSLLQRCIDKFGLTFTFVAEAAVCFILVTVSFVLIRDNPSDKGLQPLGIKMAEIDGAREHGRLKKADYLLIVPMLLFIGAVMNVSYSHLTVLITGEGFNEKIASAAISVSGASLLIGKVLYGRTCDKVGIEKSNFIFAPLFVSGVMLCCFIRQGLAVLISAMIVYSLGMAYMSVGLSSWPTLFTDKETYGKTVRIFQIGYASGSLLFSSVPGIIADSFAGSYVPSFAVFSILSVIVFLLLETVIILSKKRQ